MAAITIQNGQELANPAAETEILLPTNRPFAREIKFRVTSGTVQVTTGTRGASGVIGGSIHAYAVDQPDFMTVEPAGGVPGEGISMYVKGSGTIFFSF